MKTVGIPISRRAGAAKRNAGWNRGREAEPDAGLLHAAQHALRRQLDGDTEGLQDVGRAGLRGGAAGPVLADGDTGAGDDDRRHRRDVDRVGAVTAGADHVDGASAQLLAERHQFGRAEHGVEQPRQLVGGLALGPQGDDEADQLGRRGAAGEDRGHRRAGLLGAEVAPSEQLAQQARPAAVLGEQVGRTSGASVVGHAGKLAKGARYAERRLWRMMRRRSRSVAPPQTPAFSRDANACSRQATRTPQPAHTDFATAASSSSSG